MCRHAIFASPKAVEVHCSLEGEREWVLVSPSQFDRPAAFERASQQYVGLLDGAMREENAM